MHKQSLTLALTVVALAVVLTGCAPAAAPAPTAAPAQPVATEAPTAAPEPTDTPTATEAPAETPVPTATAVPAFTAPDGALVSVKAAAAPELDGEADEAAWAEAPELSIPVAGGANNGSTDIKLKSVYTDDMVYFVATWADPTESWLRAPWEKQADGSWKKLADPNDKGGDNNVYYEDKLSFIWNINESIKGFETAGCFGLCHVGENSDVKPYGNKYTATEGEIGDIWHWKSVRNLNQIDDQYVDSTRFSEDTKEAGRKSDAKDSGGYADNQTEDKKLPAFMAPDGGAKDGSPGYILDSEKVAFDDTLFAAGDRIPGILKSEIVGDRGDIAASWKYADGAWTLEFGRKLNTGSETDVQFDAMDGVYHFGVAVFENAQVRHGFQNGATPFVFKP
jgi:hypothetical protein